MNEITPKEIWIGIIVILVAFGVSILVRPVMMDKSLNNLRMYKEAVRIETSEQFQYAQATQIGNVLAYGEMADLNDQYTPELQGAYSGIERTDEHYTMHTREVPHTTCTGSGDNESCTTTYTIEVYWTWDVTNVSTQLSQYFKFLGINFFNKEIDIPSFQHNGSYIYTTSDDRHYYMTLPSKFHVTMFVGFFLNQPIHGSVYYETHPDNVIDGIEAHMRFMNVFYYVMWIAIVGIIYFWLAYEVLEIE